jgi:hypothetical protein
MVFSPLLLFPVPSSPSFHYRLFIKNLRKMVFFWFIIPFLVLMVLAGTRHRREEEDSGHSHDEPQYEDGEGFEKDQEGKEGNEGVKASSTPLWIFVTKVEEGSGGTTKFFCPHDCHDGKPFIGSYTSVSRHLCGVMDSDDKKGGIGITICPRISKEERQKYIKIEKVAQRKHGKNKSFNLMPHLNLVATHLHLLMVLEPLDLEEQ